MSEQHVLKCGACRSSFIVKTPDSEVELRQLVKKRSVCECGSNFILLMLHVCR